jgi:hypothetical protein
MKCRKIKRRLVPFLDGDLPPVEAERVRGHLEACESCRNEAEVLRSTLALAVQRTQERAPAPPPKDYIPQFWQKERDQEARASQELPRPVPRGIRQPLGSVFRLRYAIASVSAVLIIALAIVALLQDGKPPSHRLTGSSGEGTGRPQPPTPAVDRFAEIEKQLAELEAAVRDLRVPGPRTASFTGQEMHEIYAAIGLAAANNYRDILKMNDLAAKKYAQVASSYPETPAGREAQQILSRLN